jgi:hypothetical protein
VQVGMTDAVWPNEVNASFPGNGYQFGFQFGTIFIDLGKSRRYYYRGFDLFLSTLPEDLWDYGCRYHDYRQVDRAGYIQDSIITFYTQDPGKIGINCVNTPSFYRLSRCYRCTHGTHSPGTGDLLGTNYSYRVSGKQGLPEAVTLS